MIEAGWRVEDVAMSVVIDHASFLRFQSSWNFASPDGELCEASPSLQIGSNFSGSADEVVDP